MNRKSFHLLILSLLLPIMMNQQPTYAGDPGNNIPVEPIAATPFQNWPEAFSLENGSIRLVAVPSVGRILFIGADATNNLLRCNQELSGVVPASDATAWSNYGGDWMWPVSQKRWPDFQNGDWPPSLLLDGRPWAGRAWMNADGTKCCLLQQDYAAPLTIKVSRLIKLPPTGSIFTIEQRIERTAKSTIPVTLWHISQTAHPDTLLFPLHTSENQPSGYQVLMGPQPDTNRLSICDSTAIYHAEADGESKLGSGAPGCWIAARRDNLLLLEQATGPHIPQGTLPDNGCCIELYANKTLGYAEIETLSAEVLLAPGKAIENTLHYSLHTLPAADITPDALSAYITNTL